MFRKIIPIVVLVAILANGQDVKKKPHRLICTPPETKLLKQIHPKYPKEALAGGTKGSVVVDVVIDKNGKPTSMKVLKGDPVLAKAVLEVLPQWRWKPIRLNGTAVEFESTITVNFEPR